ncbi:hypothetical protein [Micromonospora sp. NPDC047074]|uniref:hypothetical protein n=1 Tax=Micromonospora sp. NPDC047074 TaxID=3154339 RepID=UPI0033FAAFC3
MIMDDADAVTVRFLMMMRAALRDEQPGEGTLGRTVELAGAWGTGAAADARLHAELGRLHGDCPDDDPRWAADRLMPEPREG